jgi:hypothetical protein
MLRLSATGGSSIPVSDFGRSEHTLPEASHGKIAPPQNSPAFASRSGFIQLYTTGILLSIAVLVRRVSR